MPSVTQSLRALLYLVFLVYQQSPLIHNFSIIASEGLWQPRLTLNTVTQSVLSAANDQENQTALVFKCSSYSFFCKEKKNIKAAINLPQVFQKSFQLL